jgi:hypothetical protein
MTPTIAASKAKPMRKTLPLLLLAFLLISCAPASPPTVATAQPDAPAASQPTSTAAAEPTNISATAKVVPTPTELATPTEAPKTAADYARELQLPMKSDGTLNVDSVDNFPKIEASQLLSEIARIKPIVIQMIAAQLAANPAAAECDASIGMWTNKFKAPRTYVQMIPNPSCGKAGFPNRASAIFHVRHVPSLPFPDINGDTGTDGLLVFDYIPVTDPELIQQLGGRHFLIETSFESTSVLGLPGAPETLQNNFGSWAFGFMNFPDTSKYVLMFPHIDARILQALGTQNGQEVFQNQKMIKMVKALKAHPKDPAAQRAFLLASESVIWPSARISIN